MIQTVQARRGACVFVSALLGLFAAILAFVHPAHAEGADDEAVAGAFAAALVDDLAAVANDPELDAAARETGYRAVLRERLAVDAIGRFLFAGAPADLATDDERARFDALFPDYIAAAFATEIGELAERRIDVENVVMRRETEAIVQSRLIGKDGREKATIDWRIRFIDGDPRLLDVLVERVSPLVAKRQEFSAIARREGVPALLAIMEQTIGAVDG